MTGPPTLLTPRLTLRPSAGTGAWEVELAGTVVGEAHLRRCAELPGDLLECRIQFDEPHRGAGLGAEAATAILRHAFDTVAAPAVFAVVPEHDVRGRALAARVGFLDVGLHGDGRSRVLVALPDLAGRLHHVELWVSDLAETHRTWGWLLTELGWTEYQRWRHGVSWRLGPTYLVFEDSPARRGDRHERLRPGLNHLALHAGGPDVVDRLVAEGPRHGWRLMFADRHPFAGGTDHYAAYLENGDGYEVELVAAQSRCPGSGVLGGLGG